MREHTGYSGEPKFQLPGEGYWLRVKRLTTRGALLVALQHSDAALRADLLDVLPEPTRRSTTRRFADGSLAVTLHIQPEPARLVLAACEIDACSPVREVYDRPPKPVRDSPGTWSPAGLGRLSPSLMTTPPARMRPPLATSCGW